MIDDLFGRPHLSRRPNTEREDLCARLGLIDVSPDLPTDWTQEKIEEPIAEVIFCSGQVVVSGSVENDLESVVGAVRQGWPDSATSGSPRWALVLVDLHFKTGPVDGHGEPVGRDETDFDSKKYFGLTVMQRLQREFPHLPTIVFSAMERGKVSRDFTAYGAEGFLERNAPRKALLDLLSEHGLLEDVRQDTNKRIIGCSLPLLLALREARKAAKVGGNVLITGEPGTGKELLANYIHAHSPFAKGPYVTFFPQGISDEQFWAELFGSERGSYTGQIVERKGAAERANGGTLFIDECGYIPLEVQQRFNRLLDDNTREVHKTAANKDLKLHLQIVLATNQDLHELEGARQFRSDFIGRITEFVYLPPLRERREDIPLLAETFVKSAVDKVKATSRTVTTEALEMLCNAPWPRNVRGLWITIQRAVANHRTVEHLQPHHLKFEDGPGSTVVSPQSPSTAPEGAPSLRLDELVRVLEAFQAPADYESLKGRLPKLRQAFARCMAGYLRAALLANTKRSPDTKGKINYTGAIKCMTGSKDLTTGEAKDEIKRLLQVDPDLREQITSQDLILSEAWQSAVDSRKGPSKKVKKSADRGAGLTVTVERTHSMPSLVDEVTELKA